VSVKLSEHTFSVAAARAESTPHVRVSLDPLRDPCFSRVMRMAGSAHQCRYPIPLSSNTPSPTLIQLHFPLFNAYCDCPRGCPLQNPVSMCIVPLRASRIIFPNTYAPNLLPSPPTVVQDYSFSAQALSPTFPHPVHSNLPLRLQQLSPSLNLNLTT